MDDALVAAAGRSECQPVFDSIIASSDSLHHLVLAIALESREHFRLAALRGPFAIRLACADWVAVRGTLEDMKLLARDRDHRVRLKVIEAVWALDEQEAIGFLVDFAGDRSARVRQAAAFALALRVEEGDLVERLGPFLFDPWGRPADPVVVEYRYANGEVKLVTLSEWLTESSEQAVGSLLEEWRQRAGRKNF